MSESTSKSDPLKDAYEYDETGPAHQDAAAVAMDLDRAFAALPEIFGWMVI